MEVGIAFNTHRLLTFQNLAHFKRLPFQLPSLRTTKPPSISRCNLGFFRGFSFREMVTSSNPSPLPSAFAVKEKIELTEKENQIFERLLQVVRHFSLNTQLRVAGGWVRDKLLGKECYDIDIALDDMLGREFCEKVNEYLIHKGEEQKGIGVIQCNPDQSKHLETARMRLFDIWIDFVNLRCEDYSENSRIPTMKFGTAKEDADRRDLTINSMFYNINTNLVEDFTGRGLQDLKAGVIVTPLPPKETFLDDPLRVLRAIRFGARFGFVLDEKLQEVASSDEVKAAIANKISRERVGHEIDLMVSGNQPIKAISYICDLQLFWVVFSVTPEVASATSEGRDRLCVAYMDAAWELLQRLGCLKFNDDQRRLCLYGALFLPLREISYTDNKGKKAPLVNHIFRNSLKLKASDADTVINLHTSSERFKSLIPLMTNNDAIENAEVGSIGENFELPLTSKQRILAVGSIGENFELPLTSKQRILAGPLLRQIKGFWRVALLISMLIYRTDTNHTGLLPDSHFELDDSKDLYEKIESTITELDLDNVWEKKPLVNGKEIMAILQLNPGPQVREWQEKVLEWQLAYPSGTAEECLDWIRQTKSKRAKLDVQHDQSYN